MQVTGGQWARPTQRVSRPTGINGRPSEMRFRPESFTIVELRAALKRLCEEPHQQRRTTASCVKCGEIGFSKAFPTPQGRYRLIPVPCDGFQARMAGRRWNLAPLPCAFRVNLTLCGLRTVTVQDEMPPIGGYRSEQIPRHCNGDMDGKVVSAATEPRTGGLGRT